MILYLLCREFADQSLDSRADYLKADSRGLINTLKKADRYFKNVKQTSDATIDSRLLVTAADLSYKKTNELALGDSSTGVDVDEFLSKCISFMRQDENSQTGRPGDSDFTGSSSASSQRRRRRQGMDEDDEEEEQLNWAHLGRNVCFLSNSRPCLSGFLLGPLSVQKRVRQQTQRRAREAKATIADAVRPQALEAEDMEKQETANLTVVCSEIRSLLGGIQEQGEKALQAEFDKNPELGEDEYQDEYQNLLRQVSLADDGSVPLFDFCVNPKSFGQTVENLFYVSFLIREGSVGLSFDSRGLPTLGVAGVRTVAQRQEAPKNQAVFTLDFDLWETIVESYGIQSSLIPHREEVEYDDGTNSDMNGWYD